MKDRLGHTPPLPLYHPALWLATWFGTGYLPKIPGTWGSLAALPCAWVIHWTGGSWWLAAAALGLFALGWWASSVFVAASHEHDPPAIVIDEVSGQWLTLAVVPPELWYYALGFVLFRLADILKPWPAGWADREVPGGLGVMLDDTLAAGYAASILYLIHVYMG